MKIGYKAGEYGLTILHKAKNGTMLQGDVHIEVLYIYIHLANSFFVLLTLLNELLNHFLQMGNVVRIFCNTSSVSERLSWS